MRVTLLLVFQTSLFSFLSYSQTVEVVDKINLKINGHDIYRQDKSVLITAFGQPLSIEPYLNEIEETGGNKYVYDGLVAYVISNRVQSIDITKNTYSVTSNNISIGMNLNTLQSLYPLSYAAKDSYGMFINIKDYTSYLAFAAVNGVITEINFGDY
jgi:V8-like Glu-specific endopeptidase